MSWEGHLGAAGLAVRPAGIHGADLGRGRKHHSLVAAGDVEALDRSCATTDDKITLRELLENGSHVGFKGGLLIHRFVLEAIDPNFGCPVLEAMLLITDLEPLRAILGDDSLGDPQLQAMYALGPWDLDLIAEHYGVGFEPHGRECWLGRAHSIRDAPYLVHTGYELFLMLEGRKPFAKFVFEYPAEPGEFLDEALFEPHVRSGTLIKRVMPDEPFAEPVTTSSGRVFEGLRRVFYARAGEEWRIDADQLVMRQLVSGRWNETLERLEGSLLGYSDAENDWWIARKRRVRG